LFVAQVLDFGAARDGVPESKRGRRIVVNAEGVEHDPDSAVMDIDGTADE
jgi:F-box and WD-40 domain protein CDC4